MNPQYFISDFESAITISSKIHGEESFLLKNVNTFIEISDFIEQNGDKKIRKDLHDLLEAINSLTWSVTLTLQQFRAADDQAKMMEDLLKPIIGEDFSLREKLCKSEKNDLFLPAALRICEPLINFFEEKGKPEFSKFISEFIDSVDKHYSRYFDFNYTEVINKENNKLRIIKNLMGIDGEFANMKYFKNDIKPEYNSRPYDHLYCRDTSPKINLPDNLKH